MFVCLIPLDRLTTQRQQTRPLGVTATAQGRTVRNYQGPKKGKYQRKTRPKGSGHRDTGTPLICGTEPITHKTREKSHPRAFAERFASDPGGPEPGIPPSPASSRQLLPGGRLQLWRQDKAELHRK